MAATKMQTPLSLLRASAPLGRSVHTSVFHGAQRSQALSSALVLSRHASSAASPSTTSTQAQTPQLTWDEFLKLRRTRRFINLGSSALSGAASIAVAVPAFAEFEIENIGAQMTGLDPMFIIGGSLMGVGAVGWLLGPFLGTAFFNVWKGSVRKEFARVRHGPARFLVKPHVLTKSHRRKTRTSTRTSRDSAPILPAHPSTTRFQTTTAKRSTVSPITGDGSRTREPSPERRTRTCFEQANLIPYTSVLTPFCSAQEARAISDFIPTYALTCPCPVSSFIKPTNVSNLVFPRPNPTDRSLWPNYNA